MRRRRQKNSLLPKMIGIAVLVNAILLPILAQIGAFKGIRGAREIPVKLVTLPPPKKMARPPHPAAKRRQAKARPHASGHAPVRERPNPNQPKFVASTPKTSGSGPVVENNGTGKAGLIPPAPPATPAPPSTPPVVQLAPPPPAEPVVPTPPPPVVTPPPPAHVPVVVAAQPVAEPKPQIPDDLRDSALDTAFRGLFTIHADGTADVRMIQSTGNAELDSLALGAARQWTFRPATVDGKPVDSYLRLEVDFDVS